MTRAQYVTQLAELLVGHGANVQPGQVVGVSSAPGKEELTRAIADAAYRRGAKYVDVVYFDPYVKHSRLKHSAEDTLGWVPPWIGQRVLQLGELRSASISLSGPAAPGLMDDIDPVRAGKDRLPQVPESIQMIHQGLLNWTVGPGPTQAWAELVFPDLEPVTAYWRLWDELAHVLRLDTPDPVAAWRARSDELTATAAELTELRLDCLHFRGPGTDLVVGLLPGSVWIAASMTSAGGIPFAPNLPSEEIFTTPDPTRTEGFVTATRPLDVAGTVIRGLTARFEGGRIADIRADTGAEILAGRCAMDDGAARLGEVALVENRTEPTYGVIDPQCDGSSLQALAFPALANDAPQGCRTTLQHRWHCVDPNFKFVLWFEPCTRKNHRPARKTILCLPGLQCFRAPARSDGIDPFLIKTIVHSDDVLP